MNTIEGKVIELNKKINAQLDPADYSSDVDYVKAKIAALEDGEALAALGVTDADQEVVEELHGSMLGLLNYFAFLKALDLEFLIERS